MKSFLRRLAPPILLDLYRSIRGSAAIRYEGPYESWDEAERRAEGYDSAQILESVRRAARKVKDGEAAFEQDSVTFPELELPFPLLALLLRAAGASQGHLNVLDFGGSLGSTYYRCRNFLAPAAKVRWGVVEQPVYAECGQREFADDNLKFYSSIAEYLDAESPDVALMSSSLPYVREPYRVLDELDAAQIPHIVIDRTQFHQGSHDRFFVQRVSPKIYRASYPCRVFGSGSLVGRLAKNYHLLTSFAVNEGPFRAGEVEIRYGGWGWTRRAGR